MSRLVLTLLVFLVVPALPGHTSPALRHLFICRSPLLAFDFWESLHNIEQHGVTLTPTIVAEVCRSMRAGNDPQCLRVEAESFKPVESGWAGALAMSDGVTRVWFHNPESGGWIHPNYYVTWLNLGPK